MSQFMPDLLSTTLLPAMQAAELPKTSSLAH